MLDLGHLFNQTTADIQVFNTPSTVTNLQWQTWRKPRGASMLYLLCIGGGGGGGSGFGAAAGSARGGGSGGGSGGTSLCIIPAHALPDILYIQTGAGGDVASNGVASYIAVYPDTSSVWNIVLKANFGSGGVTGTGSGAKSGGNGGGVSSIADGPWAGLGFTSYSAGITGGAGGSSAGGNGGSVSPTVGIYTTGGAGGAGITGGSADGGSITGAGSFLGLPGGTSSSVNGSSSPFHYLGFTVPLFFPGGSGGYGTNNAVGGDGGYASPGSGGGGGAGGTTGGLGGFGGTGLAVIAAL